jgi:NNP family nitrate/nitrite transporter-like MFS transporter
MYVTFGVSVICTFLLSYPATTYIVDGIKGPITFRFELGLVPFVALLFCLGFAMSLGKAAVYKHIPVYYPATIGSVGGLVGMIGGLGGFVLPIAFGMLLFLLVAGALAWMHLAVRRMERARTPGLSDLPELPEMSGLHPAPTPARVSAPLQAAE